MTAQDDPELLPWLNGAHMYGGVQRRAEEIRTETLNKYTPTWLMGHVMKAGRGFFCSQSPSSHRGQLLTRFFHFDAQFFSCGSPPSMA